MTKRTALRSRSNCAAHTWPNQAKGSSVAEEGIPKKIRGAGLIPRPYQRSMQAPRSHQSFARSQNFWVHRILARDPADNQYP
jgi:hypothetical protein